MTEHVRPRRSALYMPGANARALDKARGLPADVMLFDLEDAVAPDAKERARTQVTAALAAGGYGRRELVVRINALGSPWGGEDVAAAAQAPVDAVLIPKVEGGASVRAAESALAAAGAPADLPLWLMIETPRGVLQAAEAAAASARVAALVMGTSDLATELHARHRLGREAFLASLSQCVLVARAFGLVALDGVHLDLDDMDGFAAQCRQGRDLGFDGKTLIHPKTIDIANEVFGPDAAEIAWSRRVIAASQAAAAAGRGVAVLDGKLVENLHVTEARRVLAMADALGDG